MLDNTQITNLIIKYRETNCMEALERIILENEGLIRDSIKKIGVHDNIEDVYQEGRMGIMDAVNHYDITSDAKFSTYCVFWIRNSIFKYLEENRLISLPKYIHQRRNRLIKELNKGGFEDYSDSNIKKACEALNITFDEAMDALAVPSISKSLDEYLTDDEDTTALDMVRGNIESPDAFIDSPKNKVLTLFKSLTNEERELASRYFGIERDAETYDSISKSLSVSREAVRLRVNKILAKLRIVAAEENITVC